LGIDIAALIAANDEQRDVARHDVHEDKP